MEHRPELAGIERQIAAAHSAEKLAQQYYFPDLNVSFQHNDPYGAPGLPQSWTTGVGISVPLLFWQHQNGEVAEAKHLELELAATQRDVFAQVEQDLRNAYSTATTSYRQAVFIRDQLLPSAQEQYDIAFKTYSLGGASSLEVIDSQNALLDAKNQFATALGALNDAVADLAARRRCAARHHAFGHPPMSSHISGTRDPRFVLLAAMTGAAACSPKKSAANVAADSTTADQRPLTLSPDQREHVQDRDPGDAWRATAPRSTTTGTVAFDGNISTQVLAPISGPVLQLLVEVGAQVNRGDPLAAISSPDFAAAVSAYRKAQARRCRRSASPISTPSSSRRMGSRERDLEQSRRRTPKPPNRTAMPRSSSCARWAWTRSTIAALQDRQEERAGAGVHSRADRRHGGGEADHAGATAAGGHDAVLHRGRSVAHVGAREHLRIGPRVRFAGDQAQITGAALPHPLIGRGRSTSRRWSIRRRAPPACASRCRTPGRVLRKDMYVEAAIQSSRTCKGLLIPGLRRAAR